MSNSNAIINIISNIAIDDRSIVINYTNGKARGIVSKWPGKTSLKINGFDIEPETLIGRKVLDNRTYNSYDLVAVNGKLKNIDYLSEVYLLDNNDILIAKLILG